MNQHAPQIVEVAASPVPGEAVLPLLLPRFRQLRPDIQIRERVGDVEMVVERLLRREVQLALIGGPFTHERLGLGFLSRDEMALVAPRDHPLAQQQHLRAMDVCHYPLVLRSEGSGARTAVEQAFLAAGVERSSIQVAAELGSTEAVKRAVEAGLGVAFVSVCTLALAGPAGELRVLRFADEPPARDLLVAWEEGRELNPAATAFREFLLSEQTLREVASYTRLPASLRPSLEKAAEPVAAQADGPRASPSTGLEKDPLLPAPSSGGPTYRLAREARTPEEQRVADLLAEIPAARRADLLEHLADEMRRAQGDPLSSVPEVGVFRLELYEDEAAALLDRMLGDLLVQADPETARTQGE